MALRFALFGEVRAWRDGQALDLGPPQQREVLALMLAACGEPVSMSEMVETLWGNSPPASAVNVVHRHIGGLRRLFEPDLQMRATGRVISAGSGGYRMAVGTDDFDVLSSRALAAAGRYDAALRIATSPVAGDSARQRTLERERVATAVNAPPDAAVLPVLVQMSLNHPLNEPLHAALIRALALAGQHDDAVAAYEKLRNRLSEQLGIDPSPELQDAHHAALGFAIERPSQLPASLRGFVGREQQLASADEFRERSAETRPLTLLAVSGMSGIGKSAFALQWAHSITDDYPDGQLYANLRGFDPRGQTAAAADILGPFLQALGERSASIPAEGSDRVVMFRKAMQRRRMVVLLDNARDADHVKDLLPSGHTSLVIVTSRNRLMELDAEPGARLLALDRFDESEAHRLLVNRLGVERVTGEPQAAAAIITACAGLPLALSIVAARAATETTLPLSAVATQVHKSSHRLDAMVGDEVGVDIRAIFSWSYDALTPRAAEVFRLLSLHPGPDISTASACSLAGAHRDEFYATLAELVSANLVTEGQSGQLGIHDLLRIYARERLHKDERIASSRRLIDHFGSSAREAYLSFGRESITDASPIHDDVTPEKFPAGSSAAVDWYARERSVIAAVFAMAMELKKYRQAALLMLDCRPMTNAINDHHEVKPLMLAALEASTQLEEPNLVAELERDVGNHYARENDLAAGAPHYRRALELFRDTGDLVGESNTLRNMSTYTVESSPLVALDLIRESVAAARRSRRLDILVVALTALTGTALDVGTPQEVVANGLEAIELVHSTGVAYLLPYLTVSMGQAHLKLGDAQTALGYLEESLELATADHLVHGPLTTLPHVAYAALEAGNRDRARSAYARYLELSSELDRPFRSIVNLDSEARELLERAEEVGRQLSTDS